jgi:hypothetical protein
MATDADIQTNILTLRNFAAQFAGCELPSPEREQVRHLLVAALNLLEIVLCDLHRIADRGPKA